MNNIFISSLLLSNWNKVGNPTSAPHLLTYEALALLFTRQPVRGVFCECSEAKVT